MKNTTLIFILKVLGLTLLGTWIVISLDNFAFFLGAWMAFAFERIIETLVLAPIIWVIGVKVCKRKWGWCKTFLWVEAIAVLINIALRIAGVY